MIDDEASDDRDAPVEDPLEDAPPRAEGTPVTGAEAKPPREGERPETRSEEAKRPLALSEDRLEQWSRDELLERAAGLGIDVDPTIDRWTLIDKLSKDAEAVRLDERAAGTKRREGSGRA